MADIKRTLSIILRVITILAGPALMVLGILGVVTLGGFNIAAIFLSAYVIIFGAVIILAELKWVRFLRWFTFLLNRRGRACFYIFVGTLCFGFRGSSTTVFGIIVGVCVLIVGASQLVFSFIDNDKAAVPGQADPQAAPQQGVPPAVSAV
eukprot:gnl/Trimastix_PCT/1026.p1 GENE.gnl/Trimastix_PCT/1026~~gnl/Trimastix_PCT/1026.p1  ORF type:complete len:150 (+),score=27.38 gnl/Trimastix_PCT/1026:79-528(+)